MPDEKLATLRTEKEYYEMIAQTVVSNVGDVEEEHSKKRIRASMSSGETVASADVTESVNHVGNSSDANNLGDVEDGVNVQLVRKV